MTGAEAEKLITTIRSLVDEGRSSAATGRRNGAAAVPTTTEPATKRGDAGDVLRSLADPAIVEALYQSIKQRLIDDLRDDPLLVQLIAARPEIEVLVEPRKVEIEGSSLKGRVARLLVAGWFDTSRATGAARRELARTGADPGGGGSLSDVLSAFVRDGFLVREGDGYQKAAGLKISERVIEAR